MRNYTRFKFHEWWTASNVQRKKHEWAARSWTVFGIYGTWDYIHRNGLTLPSEGVAASIPVLFLISVLAMQQGEKNQAANYRIEQKQEEAQESAHENS